MVCVLSAGLASMFIGFAAALAAPAAQLTVCPLAADDVVSGVVGASASIFDPTFGVTVNGTDTECLFSAGGGLVLVRRTTDFFSDSASGATPEQVEQLRLMVADDVDYAPVSGVGDAALLATVRDRSLAPERMAVLISKCGTDAFAIGVMDTPEALVTTTALTHAILAQQCP